MEAHMQKPEPNSFWECLSEECMVTAFGLAEALNGQHYTQCPQCKSMSRRSTKLMWQTCRIAFNVILSRKKGDIHNPVPRA
jgi:hypothetical protein